MRWAQERPRPSGHRTAGTNPPTQTKQPTLFQVGDASVRPLIFDMVTSRSKLFIIRQAPRAERRICAAQEHISTQQKQKQSKGTHAVIFFFLTSVLRFFSIWPRPRPRPARSESCVSAAKSSEISSCTGAGKTHRLLQTKRNREKDSRADLEKDIVALLDAHLCDTSAHQAGA